MQNNVHNTAYDTLFRQRFGFAGQVLEDPRNVEKDGHNAAGTTVQTSTFAVSGAAGEDAVRFDISGPAGIPAAVVSFTTTAGANSDGLAVGEIVEAINKSTEAQRFCYAKAVGTSVVLTAVFSGTGYAFTAVKTSTIVASGVVVAATDASDILLGTAVFSEALLAATGFINGMASLGALPQPGATGLVAPNVAYLATEVQTLTVAGTADNSKRYAVRVRDLISGETETFQTVTSGSATVTNIAIEIEAVLAGSSIVTASRSTAEVTVTAVSAGAPFKIDVIKIDASTATYTAATTTAAVSTQDLLEGILAYSPVRHDGKVLGGGGQASLPANEQGLLLAEGAITVIFSGSTPVRHGKVYVGTGTGEVGKFYTAAGANRIEWRRARWQGESSGTLATLFLGPQG